MSEKRAPTRKGDHPAIGNLRGILYMIDNHKGTPTPALLKQIREGCINAIEVLKIADPYVQRVLTTVLLLLQSTQLVEKKVFGRVVEKTMITNPEDYDFAMVRLHRLMAEASAA